MDLYLNRYVMTKGGQGRVDTEDRIMRRIAATTAWAEENRQLATMAVLAILAVGAGGFIYLNYRADLAERAAVRLDELRLVSQSAPPEQLRAELAAYVDQFSSTPHGDEARLFLAEMELQRDSAAAAIRLIEPVVDPADDPLGYNAAWMLAVAEEQRGNLEAAAAWYERLARVAPHEFQRRGARAARARLHAYAGEYAAAEAIYGELAAAEDVAGDPELYALRLGEVRARAAADLPPPSVPAVPMADTSASSEPASEVEPEIDPSGTAPMGEAGEEAVPEGD
jgi:predicted negative regulator of RcsB-dependent stress response